MQPTIIISLLVLALTIFSMPFVNGAPTPTKHSVTNSTVSHKSTTPAVRHTPSQPSTKPGSSHSSPHTHSTSGTSPKKPKKLTQVTNSKTTRKITPKATTIKGKVSTTKSKAIKNRKKRLSQWDWA